MPPSISIFPCISSIVENTNDVLLELPVEKIPAFNVTVAISSSLSLSKLTLKETTVFDAVFDLGT